MKTTIFLLLIVFIAVFSAFVYSYSQDPYFTNQEFSSTTSHENGGVVKSFELRYEDPFFEPPVIVVNEGDTVDLTFMFRDDHFITIGEYVNDYYNVGKAVFKPAKGEYVIECKDCDVKAAGFLVVR